MVDLISEVIADFSQDAFHASANTNSYLKQWYARVNHRSSSLLAKSARSAMLLAQHSIKQQESAHHFAKHIDLAYNIWRELYNFKTQKKPQNTELSLLKVNSL